MDLFEINEMIINTKEAMDSGIATRKLKTMLCKGMCELLDDRSLKILPIIKDFEWEELN